MEGAYSITLVCTSHPISMSRPVQKGLHVISFENFDVSDSYSYTGV